MKLLSCSVRSMTMPMACSKSWRFAGVEIAGVGQRRVQQRVRRGDGVVDLVRHHPNQLLVGGPLELPQLLGQLLDQQEAAREAAIDERAVVALHPPRAEQPDERAPRRARAPPARPPSGDPSASSRRPTTVGGGPVEQPLGGGVEAADPLIEVEDHDAGRRDLRAPGSGTGAARRAAPAPSRR